MYHSHYTKVVIITVVRTTILKTAAGCITNKLLHFMLRGKHIHIQLHTALFSTLIVEIDEVTAVRIAILHIYTICSINALLYCMQTINSDVIHYYKNSLSWSVHKTGTIKVIYVIPHFLHSQTTIIKNIQYTYVKTSLLR